MPHTSLSTPAGIVFIQGTDEYITGIGFSEPCTPAGTTPVIETAVKQLNEYFDGSRKEFDLPLKVEGSELQVSVCDSLIKIPYGETVTYKKVAADIGNPRAIRAVATAIGRNPIAIVIPCHRVIGSDGKMRGFAGGIPFKEYLLEVEGWIPKR